MKAKDRAELVKNMVRSVFSAPLGMLLFVADFASIEARVVMWYAAEEAALQAFRGGEDIYCQMAEKIYGYPCNKKDNPEERFHGKSAILGAGYGMGVKVFKETYGVPDDIAQRCVNAYRNGYPGVKQAWNLVENIFKQAMNGQDAIWNDLPFTLETVASKECVTVELPSGRKLFYYEPEFRPGNYGPEIHVKIKTSAGMYHRKTWGGDIFQDIVQGTARDLCVFGTMEVEKLGYKPVMTVHDEVVCVAPEDKSLEEFEKAFSKTPDWANGIPVSAEGWKGKWYRKG